VSGGGTDPAFGDDSAIWRPGDSLEPMDESQGLALRTEYLLLDWTLRFTHPTVIIDDHLKECPWGEDFFPLEPGPHQIEIFYRYLGRRAGRASLVVDVRPNQVITAFYRTPNSILIGFLPGKLSVEPSDNSMV
jgi:hypothetical protein